MGDNLDTARSLVQQIRFLKDKGKPDDCNNRNGLELLKGQIFLHELRMTEDVTPKLKKKFDVVCRNLKIPPGTIDCFVYASPNVQAECYADSHNCVLRFSSSLIELLTEEEFAFIAGHEIGHFLCGHSAYTCEENSASLGTLRQRRYQEISADRVGLMACKSLDSAIRAMIKTVSGLSEKHLRFDVGSFIDQLRHASSARFPATHPAMIIRCRALLWFSMHKAYRNLEDDNLSITTETLDKRIIQDFKKFIDKNTDTIIEQAKENVFLWVTAANIVEQGVFTKKMQAAFKQEFGESTLSSMIRMLADLPVETLKNEVQKRLAEAQGSLRYLLPDEYEDEITELYKMGSLIIGKELTTNKR